MTILTAEQFQNRFSRLTVEETSKADSSGPQAPDQPLEVVPTVVVERSQAEIEDEFLSAIYALLQELRNIRAYNKRAWTAYKQRQMDLVHGVSSCEHRCRPCPADRPVVQGYNTTTDTLSRLSLSLWTLPTLRYCIQFPNFEKGSLEQRTEFLKPSKYLLGSNMPACDFCFYPVYVGLKAFLWSMDGESPFLPEIPMSQFGAGPLPADMGRTVEMALLYRMSFDTYVSAQMTHGEVTRGMRYLVDNKVIPICVTIGIQVLLDVHKTLGTSMRRAFSDLCEHVQIVGLSVPSDDHPFQQESTADQAADRHFSLIQDDIRRACQDDQIHAQLREEPGIWEKIKHNTILSRMMNEKNFIKRQPILCVLMKYRMFAAMGSRQVDLEHHQNDMFAMAYIYIASRIIQPDAPTWPDMEFAIYHQDPAWIFHGGKPTTLEAAEMAFFLACGSSVVNSARNQRKNVRTTNSPRNFRKSRKPDGFLLQELLRRLNMTTMPKDNPEQVILGTAADTLVPDLIQALNDPDNQKRMMRQMNLPMNITKLPLPHNGGTSRDPRSLEVLGALVNWLQADRIDLYFDWRAFQRQWTRNWTDILRTLSEDPEWQETDFVEESRHTSMFAALDILWLSVNSEQRISICA